MKIYKTEQLLIRAGPIRHKCIREERMGVRPRWQSRKTLSSPPPIGTPKLQLFTGKLLTRKTGRLKKRSSTTKHINKEP